VELRAARFLLNRPRVRKILALTTLFAFGCAELRYASRTEMVEVAPEPAVVAQPTPSPTPAPRAVPTRSDSQALAIGGTIAAVVGGALILGGAVGWQNQEAANAAADAQCVARGGWFCGLFEGFSYMPYGTLIAFGGMAVVTGIVLVGVGASRLDRAKRWNARPH
jgi:hypothetical protein